MGWRGSETRSCRQLAAYDVRNEGVAEKLDSGEVARGKTIHPRPPNAEGSGVWHRAIGYHV